MPHEDYPRRVPATIKAITQVMTLAADADADNPPRITNRLISLVHATIFPDHGPAAGHFRHVNVTVGSTRPPDWQRVNLLMRQLESLYLPLPLTLDNLRHWHLDFEIIHPFIDGNGRTGGAIVAALSYPLAGRHLTSSQ